MRERSWPPHRAQSFWGARCHQRRTAQVDFRRAERIQAGRTNDRTRWYDHRARAEVSFRKSRHLSGGGTRPEIFFHLSAFACGEGRKDRRLSSPKSSLSGSDRNTTPRSGSFFQQAIATDKILTPVLRWPVFPGSAIWRSRLPGDCAKDFPECIQSIATQRYGSKALAYESEHGSHFPRFQMSSSCRRAGSLVNLAENSEHSPENRSRSSSLVFGIARPAPIFRTPASASEMAPLCAAPSKSICSIATGNCMAMLPTQHSMTSFCMFFSNEVASNFLPAPALIGTCLRFNSTSPHSEM